MTRLVLYEHEHQEQSKLQALSKVIIESRQPTELLQELCDASILLSERKCLGTDIETS